MLEKKFLRRNREHSLSLLARIFDLAGPSEFRAKRSHNSQQAELQLAQFDRGPWWLRPAEVRSQLKAGAWTLSEGLNLSRIFGLRQRVSIAIDRYYRAAALVDQKYLSASHARIDIRLTCKESGPFERLDRKVVLHLLS